MHWTKLFRFTYSKTVKNYVQQSATKRRHVGNFRRPNLRIKGDQLLDIKDEFFSNRTELSSGDWDRITELLVNKYRHINESNIDAIIVGVCSEPKHLPLAKSYIRHLKSNGKQPNDASLGKLLKIYNVVYHTRGGTRNALTKEEQEEILQIYDTIKSKHGILDCSSCESLIHGLVATENWRDSLELLEMMNISSNAPSLSAYSEIIIKAFATNDMQLGWQLLHQMLEKQKQPKCEIFLALLETILKYNIQNFYSEVEKLLMFLESNNILLSQKVISALENIALIHPNLLMAKTTTLTGFGKCSSCGNHMKNISLCDEDFKKLQKSFLDKVLIRNDVFQKSTPLEVQQFCNYIEQQGPFDCVVDGLNVAYSTGSKKPIQSLANLLASVVKYFKRQNKHVLILGRKHMNKWPKRTMQYIKDNAAVFLANDISEDDPFLLYATLKSGQLTDFFSRDLMRQHAFLLGPELKVIFRRWQQEHQYSLVTQTQSGAIIVKKPIRHLICAHKVQDVWHVPYKEEYTPHIADCFETPKHWLCLKILK